MTIEEEMRINLELARNYRESKRKAYRVIENPMVGKTYYHEDRWGVYEYGTYESGSVLAGQEKRTMLDSFNSEEEARAAYPDAELSRGSAYREVHIPETPPEWFDPEAAGERWDDD